MINDNNLIWMDLEFTGLSDDQVIIETACIITDKNLEIAGFNFNLPFDVVPWKIYDIFLLDAFTYIIVIAIFSICSEAITAASDTDKILFRSISPIEVLG